MRLIVFLLIIPVGLILFHDPDALAGYQEAWPDIAVDSIVNGLENPVHITNAGDGSGRLFVVEQAGRIKIIKNGLVQSTFLDIVERVRSPNNGGGNEEGLLSVAFPPGYGVTKSHLYVYYTLNNGDNLVSRFYLSGNPNQVDPDSEEKILELPHPTYSNHNGGQLAFGPDGYLYISTGDGGGGGDPFGNAQNPGSLLGKLLRIDVEVNQTKQLSGVLMNYLPVVMKSSSDLPGGLAYRIPPDNPFIGSEGYREEIWALGLRNPWRFSFDRQAGELYIGDVGQNTWEEIDYQPATSPGGENYGWDIMEGEQCYSSSTCNKIGLSLPIFTYQTNVDGCSVTGGFVYRGSSYPGLQGIYFLGDYCSGKIWGLQNNGSAWEQSLLLDSPVQISSFGEDEAGEIYLADRNSGIIYKLVELLP